jgi:PKD repeat protein
MKKNLPLSRLLTFLLLFTSAYLQAQTPAPCSTDQAMKEFIQDNPQAVQSMKNFEQFAAQFKVENKTNGTGPDYIIPVVFHVIHNYGAENISDAQIIDGVKAMNEDFRKLNDDTTKIVNAFLGVAADTKIEFRLAKLDPNGNCTNGIERIVSTKTYNANNSSKFNPWPRNKYLNIWTVSNLASGAAGYAYYASGNPSPAIDGIIILADYVGTIGTGTKTRSVALSHEAAHCLNLLHVWGDTNNPEVSCSGDDFVSDTPPTKGHSKCITNDQTCTPGVTENVQNYMEYAYCSCMFTQGQAGRMTACLNATDAQRNNLWTPANLQATGVVPASTCLPSLKADFSAIYLPAIICQGSTVYFADKSWSGTPTSWKWTFDGGSPASSTNSVPVITYTAPGKYNVKLVVSDSNSTDSITKTAYIEVISTSTSNAGPVIEGFEGGSIPANWIVAKSSTISWQYSNAAAASGSSSVYVSNNNAATGQNTELILPMTDLTKVTNPKIYYKYASAQLSSTSIDSLKLYVSTDCGASWYLRKSMVGTTLSKAGIVPGVFVPSANQWSEDSISMALFATEKNAIIKFHFGSGGGNNIYLDDINIRTPGMKPDGVQDLFQEFNFRMFPNPTENTAHISFRLKESDVVSIELFDIVGKKIKQVLSATTLSPGDHQYSFGKNEQLTSGMYFVRVHINNHQLTQQLVIQ